MIFLVGQKCGILAFEQGLGKTLTAIEAFLEFASSAPCSAHARTMPEFAKADMELGDRKIRSDLDRQNYRGALLGKGGPHWRMHPRM